jgi:hypothetical protein
VALEQIVAIVDKVPDYAKRLAVFLNRSRSFPYRAVVFSSVKEAESYIKSAAVYAVIAAEEYEKDAYEVMAGWVGRLFLISEEDGIYRENIIYRYKSAKDIKKQIIGMKTVEKRMPVIGFFSPAGGDGAEELSRRLAEALGEVGRVLYLSLFPFGICGRDAGDGLSEALYCIRQKKQGDGLLGQLLHREGNVDYLGPVRWYTDLEEVTGEDLGLLVRGETWGQTYRTVVLAVGTFDSVGKAALRLCDRIFVPVWERGQSKDVLEEFRRQIKESGESGIYAGLTEFSPEESLQRVITGMQSILREEGGST